MANISNVLVQKIKNHVNNLEQPLYYLMATTLLPFPYDNKQFLKRLRKYNEELKAAKQTSMINERKEYIEAIINLVENVNMEIDKDKNLIFEEKAIKLYDQIKHLLPPHEIITRETKIENGEILFISENLRNDYRSCFEEIEKINDSNVILTLISENYSDTFEALLYQEIFKKNSAFKKINIL